MVFRVHMRAATYDGNEVPFKEGQIKKLLVYHSICVCLIHSNSNDNEGTFSILYQFIYMLEYTQQQKIKSE